MFCNSGMSGGTVLRSHHTWTGAMMTTTWTLLRGGGSFPSLRGTGNEPTLTTATRQRAHRHEASHAKKKGGSLPTLPLDHRPR